MLRSFVALLLLAAGGCDGCRSPAPHVRDEYQDDEQQAEVTEEETAPDPLSPPPPAVAETAVPAPEEAERPPQIVPAPSIDQEWASDEVVHAHRYVYRVYMAVPAGLGEGTNRIARPAAELFVDVAPERLRARFAGAGWPVPAGSEVRLRRDRPGVYVFDAQGGRPLAPNEMASWFEGGPVTRRGPLLRILAHIGARAAPPPSDDGRPPGDLVCALLAEWSGEPREDGVMRRCERGAPHVWRLGFWRADQTAGVPVELPRSALRADHLAPPAPVARQTSRSFLEPTALSRLVPASLTGSPTEDAPAEGLRITNSSATRVIVTLQGLAIGWIDSSADAHFVGLPRGTYELAAVRPLGATVQSPREVFVPGLHRICDGRCRRTPPEDG